MRLFICLLCAVIGLVFFLKDARADELTVTGIGYPPIRAVNEAQALAMARRAAMLDAYSRALYENTTFEASESDPHFYRDLSGFIQGMAVAEESYLADGAVKVTLRKKDSSPLPENLSLRRSPLSMLGRQPEFRAPRSISRQEWSHVIEKIVTFADKRVQEMK